MAFAFAQTPVILPGGVVNGASFTPAASPDASVAPGSIMSIFGMNLAVETVYAKGVPLPTNLGGTRVTIRGFAAPLFFVSPGQINAQVPWEVLSPPGPVQVTVRTSAGVSELAGVIVTPQSLGIFTQNAMGLGPGLIQNYVSEGNTPLNGFAVTAKPNDLITLYFTGGGPVQNRPLTGRPGTGQIMTIQTSALIGGRPAAIEFIGMAPGFVGLYQANLRVPAGTPEGCFVPVQLSSGGTYGNTATIAVSAAGNCREAETGSPAPGSGESFALANLQRTRVISASNGQPLLSPADVFQASFGHFPEGSTPAAKSGIPPAGGGCAVETIHTETSATIGEYLLEGGPLNAGSLELSGPGFQQTLSPRVPGSYRATLGEGGFQAGTWTLSGSGGVDIGSFGPVDVTIPAPLLVTSFGFSTTIHQSQPMHLTWMCPRANDNSLVSVAVISFNDSLDLQGTAVCSVVCQQGGITIGPEILRQLPLSSANTAGVQVIYAPSRSGSGLLDAEGLDQGIFLYQDSLISWGATMIF